MPQPTASGDLITQDSTGHLAMGRAPNDLAQIIAVDGHRALRVDCMNCVSHTDFWGFATLLFFVIALGYAGLMRK